MSDERIDLLRSLIRDIPDFPKSGIMFKDITPLLADAEALRVCIRLFAERLNSDNVDVVVGIESRGFIFGAALADHLGAGFVPVRKPGKLPYETRRVEYELEYGTDAVEVHTDAFKPGARVVICDDLIATGGTAAATGHLVQQCGAELIAYAFVVNLSFLDGVGKLDSVPVITLVDY